MHHTVCVPPLTVLSRFCIPGFCSKCGAWLGYDSNRYLQKKTDYYKYQSWTNQQIGNLISLNNHFDEAPKKTQFERNMRLLLSQNINIGSMKRKVLRWGQPGKLIEIKSFIDLSFSLKVPVQELLFSKLNIEKTHAKPMLDKPTNPNKSSHNIDYPYIIRNCLNYELLTNRENPFPSLSEISKRMGLSEAMLKYHCTDLCKLISDKHKESYSRYNEEVRSKRVQEIRELVMDLHLQGIRPTYKLVRAMLPKSYFNINGEGYSAWRETCEELGYL